VATCFKHWAREKADEERKPTEKTWSGKFEEGESQRERRKRRDY